MVWGDLIQIVIQGTSFKGSIKKVILIKVIKIKIFD